MPKRPKPTHITPSQQKRLDYLRQASTVLDHWQTRGGYLAVKLRNKDGSVSTLYYGRRGAYLGANLV